MPPKKPGQEKQFGMRFEIIKKWNEIYYKIKWEEIIIRLAKANKNADGEPIAASGTAPSEEQKGALLGGCGEYMDDDDYYVDDEPEESP